jgi:hypothetical protein
VIARPTFALFCALLLCAGCSGESAPTAPVESVTAPPSPPAPPAPPASFINKVWQVRDSSGVVPGTLYAYFSDGTLLITSANSRPALGSWKYEGGRLTMIEEGIAYPVDVLELSAALFRVRVHNPGDPLEITFVPADTPPPGTAPDRRY